MQESPYPYDLLQDSPYGLLQDPQKEEGIFIHHVALVVSRIPLPRTGHLFRPFVSACWFTFFTLCAFQLPGFDGMGLRGWHIEEKIGYMRVRSGLWDPVSKFRLVGRRVFLS
nr:hypothetical protein Q903MT_gene1273 [Picea sitchensis]